MTRERPSSGGGTNAGRHPAPPRPADDPAVAHERLLLATEGAGVGTYDLDIASGHGYWSPRAFALLGMEPTPDGAARLEAWSERIHEADRARIAAEHAAAAARGGAWQAEYRIVRADDGAVVWLQTFGHFTHTASGHVRSTGVVIDITEKKQAEASLRESESRLRRSQEAGGVGSYEWFMDGSGGTQSEGMLRLIGLPPGRNYTFKEIIAPVLPEDMEDVIATTRAIREGSPRRETHYRVRRSDGEVRWIRDIGQLERDEAGRPYRWVGIVQDITEEKRAEERRELLINELNHRVKNTLAVVQSLAHQTLRSALPLDAARASFEQRLVALATAHDLLTKESWQSIAITELVDGALKALGVAESRVAVAGPDLQMKPKPAVSLSMALHELGTNAMKYGSLSVETGRVAVNWGLEGETFVFSWVERGGPPPPEVRQPGFGTRMIQLALAAELDGSAELRFEADGLTCRVTAPLGNAVEPGRA
ncbi:sensor histidine kinase [Erythrobacter sp. NE805]|uniref:sensor histidine kinase n=1 Tax=Erythrobacter sp. NE805 TaxID=3389875 RepID=UPI00396B39F4